MFVRPERVVVPYRIHPSHLLAVSHDPRIVSEHYLELKLIIVLVLGYKTHVKHFVYAI